ncbi:protein SODIUM POTASSIUM ROOT DEFECTIVE 2-like [Cornus florida]|uniref:protein SODIUM POTASSIUM ROOT DEFECTIVE 2-like n=1 Tax=Cornus florida TaxID=4283 RepID=UPI00289C72F9|nr:protein SODIUM POTASSIUM ROOT DEFECTIVE 2-like [Cornus florida]
MKRMDLFCASPASTAICSSMEQRSMVRHATRPIDRHSHRLGDRRKGRTPITCSSQLPIDPKTYYQKYQKSSSAKQNDVQRRRSSADIADLPSPAASSRYLLSDTPFFSLLSDSDHLKALVPSQPMRPRPRPPQSSNNCPALRSLSTGSRPHEQVVELRVSLHCKGCEGKVRKHISRMEGVKSFSIDLATKKVTIIGNVTPLDVLTSISRVKSAQFWPSPTSSSSSSSPSSLSSPAVGLS